MTAPLATEPATEPAEAPAPADPLVEVRDLTITFPATGGADAVRAVDGLSFTLRPGGALGIVGESGSGKSTVAATLLDLHRGTGARTEGTVRVAGTDVLAAPEADLRALRGATAAMIFQDPLSSLDPYHSLGDQIAEVHRVHRPGVSRRAARARAVEALDRVGIPDAARRARSRPHEFSGGMRQRALIAMALACEPRLLIADEPTTALDVTVQAQILDLLHTLRTETGTGLLLVTHDLGVVAGSVDDVLVMRGGRAVEHGPVTEVLGAPREPYTRALLAAVPRIETARERAAHAGVAYEEEGREAGAARRGADAGRRGPAAGRPADSPRPAGPARPDDSAPPADSARPDEPVRPAVPAARTAVATVTDRVPRPTTGDDDHNGAPLLEARGLRREFGRGGPLGSVLGGDRTVAVDDVSLTVAAGETLGLVGESGSGKTTVGRMLVRLLDPTAGTLRYRGRDLGTLGERALRPLRGELQMVFQDPVSSLNPRRTIGESVADPLRAAGGLDDATVVRRARELLERVGLDPAWYHRYPHEFSGGQRQRIGIARALAPGPRLLVCDEPVSALDVTTQAQVMDLLAELRRDLGLSVVLIAHDLAVVRAASDRVAVMRAGRIVEEGPVDTVYDHPQHPYTQGLLAAVPVLDPEVAAERRAARARV
ncbi:dipeptide ABC transporter ATP-binding protein [Streptomyces benahoarensis]|uniref:ABC transporter ATP-binding protein n=1 Tax=Streptomyces benahoarensis TaxID=2595054 RepID=A0A553Z5Q2_9ACTN|nr:ABC transporter ATP-binding protein [Streptomyces benahoarensis]TSB26393.1 ABC transporter ATP-binding protein [Streptomyces benahoarensis]TSB36751.1 ABC transporter ATP-binding protein [Streptomyces benahoarensis]